MSYTRYPPQPTAEISRYIPPLIFFVFTFLHKNHFKKRKCILWRYKLVSYLINIHSLKWCLKKFKIVNILMLQLCLKFYFLQTNAAWKEHVHELAIGRSWKEMRTVLAWVLLSPEVPLRAARQEGAVSTQRPPGHVCPSAHSCRTLTPSPPLWGSGRGGKGHASE